MTVLDYQFDSRDSDVILLTAELDQTTEFHVHKCILAAASPFFNDMFSLPQVPDDKFIGKQPIIPIIFVSEPCHILDALLRYVYLVTQCAIDELTDVIGTAIKYEFTAAIRALRKLLISPCFLRASPIRVYAVACRYKFDEEARIASRHTLSVNLLDTLAARSKELKYISAYEYHRLLRLHALRASAAINLLKIPENIKCMQCNGSALTMHKAPKWWYEFEKKASEELAVRPTTDVVFGLDFLFGSVSSSGCSGCLESIFHSWRFLHLVQESIDALPATVVMD